MPEASSSSAIRKVSGNLAKWGIGLRPQYFSALEACDSLPMLEIMSDNLMFHEGGPALARTLALAERGPVLLHGVGLDIGGCDPLDETYLNELSRLITLFQPAVVSDHLCFTRAGGRSTYELLPIPRHRRYLQHISERIKRVQEKLGRRICLENPSAYASYVDDEMSEGEFFSELVARSGCGVLLDVNNLYVNSYNFNFDAARELLKFPIESIEQVHVAGYTDCGSYLFDTHDKSPAPHVLNLLRLTLAALPAVSLPVILEWDQQDANLEQVLGELTKVQKAIFLRREDESHAHP